MPPDTLSSKDSEIVGISAKPGLLDYTLWPTGEYETTITEVEIKDRDREPKQYIRIKTALGVSGCIFMSTYIDLWGHSRHFKYEPERAPRDPTWLLGRRVNVKITSESGGSGLPLMNAIRTITWPKDEEYVEPGIIKPHRKAFVRKSKAPGGTRSGRVSGKGGQKSNKPKAETNRGNNKATRGRTKA
jgi:hypothetical protein